MVYSTSQSEKMKLLSIVLLLLTLSLCERIEGEEIGSCGAERSKEYDECFARALMVSKNQTLPSNLPQVEKLCS